jgi:hypothetical protein
MAQGSDIKSTRLIYVYNDFMVFESKTEERDKFLSDFMVSTRSELD